MSESLAAEIEKDYGKPGFKIPYNLQSIARQYDMNPFDLLNQTYEAVTGKELLLPPPIQKTLKMTPEEQELIKNFPTPLRTTRAWSSTGTFNKEAVPLNMGDTVLKAGETYNIDPGIIAALIQTESSWIPGQTSKSGAQGLAQFMPDTAAEMGVDVNDPVSSIMGAAAYLRKMMDENGFDIQRAIYAYNAGPNGGVGLTKENKEYYPKVMQAYAKYSGDNTTWNDPALIRPNMRNVVYKITDIRTPGNMSLTSTGPHLDVKKVGGGRFNPRALDNYVIVENHRTLGRVPLGDVAVTDSFDNHVARNSHGIDFGLAPGAEISLVNGARVISSVPSPHGDILTFEIPNGDRYTFLHGRTQ